ncbi:hypothetical protein HPB50_013535 [Hyalomma asiaticum]|uniref:Uncharacterized protein n=1 Tax=Hyalomma asiaticum TaxID=266040 RepID=A0ACB7TNL8_HYAAI|nr:hypothetical protein HPB50_013535 [Hyalomma asiaticum]
MTRQLDTCGKTEGRASAAQVGEARVLLFACATLRMTGNVQPLPALARVSLSLLRRRASGRLLLNSLRRLLPSRRNSDGEFSFAAPVAERRVVCSLRALLPDCLVAFTPCWPATSPVVFARQWSSSITHGPLTPDCSVRTVVCAREEPPLDSNLAAPPVARCALRSVTLFRARSDSEQGGVHRAGSFLCLFTCSYSPCACTIITD